MSASDRARRAALPVGAFVVIAAAHLGWHATFTERDPVQDRWAPVVGVDWFDAYRDGQEYWLSYAYGISAAFTAVALRRWRERRRAAAAGVAFGSAAASGLFAAASCWLLGCCGSPMLSIYLTLLGPAVLPFAKPAVAALTTASVVIGSWWVRRTERSTSNPTCESCTC